MKKIDQWWQELKPILEETDGQETRQIFCHKPKGDSYEYAIVNSTDDGEIINVIILYRGKAFELDSSELEEK